MNENRRSAGKTKNDRVWEEIFRELAVLETIDTAGRFDITAGTIKKFGREPRLAAKFDHCGQLPKIFRKNELAILPTARGHYAIGPFKAYETLPTETGKAKQKYRYKNFPNYIKSLDHENITSEAAALSCAYISGILADFLNESGLIPTVSGRMGSGKFNFFIQGTDNGVTGLTVENAQIEIDAGYETSSSLILIEAKNALPEDFIIRQLFYPYRLWYDRLGGAKNIRPVFMTFSNGTYKLYEYAFQNPVEYNSIKLVRALKYKIGADKISIQDIKALLTPTEAHPEPEGAPFPQADSFDRVVNLCEILLQYGKLDRYTISDYYTFTPRQSRYYADAARYLGLVHSESGRDGASYKLTEEGRRLFSLGRRERSLGLAQRILRQKAFKSTLEHYFDHNGQLPETDTIVKYMEESNLRGLRKGSTTWGRRARTVESWVQWVLELIDS